jgi:DivIVA domain-containing protein
MTLCGITHEGVSPVGSPTVRGQWVAPPSRRLTVTVATEADSMSVVARIGSDWERGRSDPGAHDPGTTPCPMTWTRPAPHRFRLPPTGDSSPARPRGDCHADLMTKQLSFPVALRGYSRKDVDALVDLVETARLTRDIVLVRQAQEALAVPGIRIKTRGYDCDQVHQYLTQARTEFGTPVV